jgi:hypothetical protein
LSNKKCTIIEETLNKEENGILYKSIHYLLQTLNGLLRNHKNEKCYQIFYLNLFKENKIQVDTYGHTKVTYNIQSKSLNIISIKSFMKKSIYYFKRLIGSCCLYL